MTRIQRRRITKHRVKQLLAGRELFKYNKFHRNDYNRIIREILK